MTRPPFEYKTEPFDLQREWLHRTREMPAHGFFWEMGTGKSKMIIDTATWLYSQGEIDGALIISINSAYLNWPLVEIPKHLPNSFAEQSRVFTYESKRASTQWHKRACEDALRYEGLSIVCMSYDAFRTKLGRAFAWKFLQKRRVLYTIDESWAVRNAGAKRSRSVWMSGRHATYKRLLNGTPVSSGPENLWSQMRFLDEDFWAKHDLHDPEDLRQMFCKLQHIPNTTRNFVVGHRDLDKLRGWLYDGNITSRVLKSEMCDLPPKQYSTVWFDLSPEQRRAYDQLQQKYETELRDGQITSAKGVLDRLVRFMQITAGYAKTEEDVMYRFADNPRLGPLEEWRDGGAQNGVVWSRYDADVEQVLATLGDDAVRYDGKVEPAQRQRNLEAWRRGDKRWLAAKTSVGGAGLTLVETADTLYYTNGYGLLYRQQSEDRFHRPGQTRAVSYTDILARDTVDESVRDALMRDYDIALQITGDQVREWL